MRRRIFIATVLSFFLLPFVSSFLAHTLPTRGVIRFKVRVKVKEGTAYKELPRKRFFLIKGSLDDNEALTDKITQTAVMSRECYYRRKGASEALIKWLKDNDCDSVYCREIDERYVTGDEIVPEFKAAYDAGLRSYKSPEIARRWLTVNLSEEIRSGYYNEKQKIIAELIKQAEAATKSSVLSVMTDRNGGAYLTDIEPGIYTVTNLVGSETATHSILWICEKEVKSANLTADMGRWVLSSPKDARANCEGVQSSLPVCPK